MSCRGRFGWVCNRTIILYAFSPSSSDTYDIYYANPKLCPCLVAEPARYEAGAVWTLEEGRSDATVDDICDFIVEYINSDVMVCSHSRICTFVEFTY
jgi:hypothetical protein